MVLTLGSSPPSPSSCTLFPKLILIDVLFHVISLAEAGSPSPATAYRSFSSVHCLKFSSHRWSNSNTKEEVTETWKNLLTFYSHRRVTVNDRISWLFPTTNPTQSHFTEVWPRSRTTISWSSALAYALKTQPHFPIPWSSYHSASPDMAGVL